MSKLIRDGLTIWVFDVQDAAGRPAELEIRVSGGKVSWSGPPEWKASPEVTDQVAAAAEEAEELALKQRGS